MSIKCPKCEYENGYKYYSDGRNYFRCPQCLYECLLKLSNIIKSNL